jgi:hypothetical protein
MLEKGCVCCPGVHHCMFVINKDITDFLVNWEKNDQNGKKTPYPCEKKNI